MPILIPDGSALVSPQSLAAFTDGTSQQQRVSVGAPFAGIQRIVMVEGEVGIQADTLVATMIQNSAGTVTTGLNNIIVPAGKTFRVFSVQYTVYAISATTPPWIRVRLRFNPTSTVVIGSPAYFSMVAGPSAAANNSSSGWAMTDPKGLFDLTAGGTAGGWGLSKSGPSTTPANAHFNLTIVGYEIQE